MCLLPVWVYNALRQLYSLTSAVRGLPSNIEEGIPSWIPFITLWWPQYPLCPPKVTAWLEWQELQSGRHHCPPPEFYFLIIQAQRESFIVRLGESWNDRLCGSTWPERRRFLFHPREREPGIEVVFILAADFGPVLILVTFIHLNYFWLVLYVVVPSDPSLRPRVSAKSTEWAPASMRQRHTCKNMHSRSYHASGTDELLSVTWRVLKNSRRRWYSIDLQYLLHKGCWLWSWSQYQPYLPVTVLQHWPGVQKQNMFNMESSWGSGSHVCGQSDCNPPVCWLD